MPIHVVHAVSQTLQASYVQSPTVALLTDAEATEQVEGVPRDAADSVMCGDLSQWLGGQIPPNASAAMVWLRGDRLLHGSSAAIRRELLLPGQVRRLPVHLPCLPEADLLAVQPRLFTAAGNGPVRASLTVRLRIASTGTPSATAVGVLRQIKEAWAEMSLALFEAGRDPAAAFDGLASIWKTRSLDPVTAALVLRNLVVVSLRLGDCARAEELLAQATKAYADYADLYYLGALSSLSQKRFAKALEQLEQAKKTIDRTFVGSDGANSYRADWLMGLMAAAVGNQAASFQHFLRGATAWPVFKPALDELLKLRLDHATVERLQWDLCAVARRESEHLEGIFEFFLLHGVPDAAHRMVATMDLPEETRRRLEARLHSAVPSDGRNGEQRCRAGVILSGPFFEHSSLARINRELGKAMLSARRLDAGLEPYGQPRLSPREFADAALLADGLSKQPGRLDLTIRHQWPPDFRRPLHGKLAVILPWEYGAVPRAWVDDIRRNVDEVWAPSSFVQRTLVNAGIETERVRMIPNGVDIQTFSPAGASWKPFGARSFVFLYVGGAIRRKGIDLLLQAYAAAFSPADDVTLLLCLTGTDTSYRHNSLLDLARQFAANPAFPHAMLVNRKLSDAELAALYRGSNALVLPYRGEGFGLPLLESMACGRPVITTAAGPAEEFCPLDSSYLVPAELRPVSEARPPLGPLVGEFTWFEPDCADLAAALRRAAGDPAEAARRGTAAGEYVRARYNWQRVTDVYLTRIRSLTAQGGANVVSDVMHDRA